MKIIEELYYGNLNTEINLSADKDYQKNLQIIMNNEEILIKLLDEKEKKLLLEMIHAYSKVDGENSVANFTLGFKTGVKFMI